MDAILESGRAALQSLPMFIAVTAVFAVFERLWPAGPPKTGKGWLLNVGITILYIVLPVTVAAITATILAALGDSIGLGLIDLRPQFRNSLLGAAATTVIWIAVFDFFYYWWHRLQHEQPFFWRIHKLHHIDPELGVSTNYRHHWLEDIFRVPFIILPMAVLFRLEPAIGFVLVVWTVFIHTNLRLHLGPLARVIAGPQLHRIHHSRLPEHFDRNYAAFLPIYDQLFGTYFYPRRDEYPPTGVEGEAEMTSVREAALLPFTRPRTPWKPRPPRDGTRRSGAWRSS